MKIPVLMYHGVANDPSKVPYGFLLQPTDQFERCMRYLVRQGFTTISLDDLYTHLKDGKALPPKPIVLTFDDGYLDNWVFVYPILKKYGLKGTIFVVTDFVDPEPGCRPNLDDVRGDAKSVSRLRWQGYLSWAEMRKMEADGVFDIQGHTKSHTWYFRSDKIVDFHHPQDSYPWLAWNHSPERKYRWVDEVQETFVEYGAPVYENGRSLGIRRYFEDGELTRHLQAYVLDHGGKKFFSNSQWRSSLHDLAAQFRENHGDHGRYESDEEYRARLRAEIVDSKAILEANLKKEIRFLCWPGGAHAEEAYTLAMDSGYMATTKGTIKNSYGNDPSKIHRTGTYLDSRQYSRGFLNLVALPFFVFEVQSYRDQPLADLVMRGAAGLVRKVNALRKISKGGATTQSPVG